MYKAVNFESCPNFVGNQRVLSSVRKRIIIVRHLPPVSQHQRGNLVWLDLNSSNVYVSYLAPFKSILFPQLKQIFQTPAQQVPTLLFAEGSNLK